MFLGVFCFLSHFVAIESHLGSIFLTFQAILMPEFCHWDPLERGQQTIAELVTSSFSEYE